MSKELDESWQRFPEARVRTNDDGLKVILEGLGEDGFCVSSAPRISLDDDGVYVSMLLNVGKHGSIIALPLDVLIPIPAKLLVKKPVKEKKKKKNEAKPPVTIPDVPPVVELHDDFATTTDGPIAKHDGV